MIKIIKKKLKGLRNKHVWFDILFRTIHYYRLNDADKFIMEFGHGTGNKRKMRRNLFKYGCTYADYFLLGIEGRKEGARDFITYINEFKYFDILNKPENRADFDDKSRTYEFFGKYYRRALKKISSCADFDEWCESHTEFIVKPIDAYRGNGVRVVRSGADISEIRKEYLFSVPFVVEELIKQSDVMASLHPSSVNTVRVPTILTKNKDDVRAFYPCLRIGQHGNVVDNAGAGGILCQIDENGVVFTDGCDEHGNTYEEQPDTHIKFRGFCLPEWDKAMALCREAALSYPGNRYIGFDIAHTEEYGWVIVEANARGELLGTQICDKIGKKKELEAIIGGSGN